jgi:hypothetical protein
LQGEGKILYHRLRLEKRKRLRKLSVEDEAWKVETLLLPSQLITKSHKKRKIVAAEIKHGANAHAA